MGSKNLVGLGVSEDLDKPISIGVGARPAVSGKGEVADSVLDSSLLQLLLGLANPGDLGVCVDDGGNSVVVNVTVTSGDRLGHRDALLLGLVGEHWPRDHIADGEDALLVGLELPIDLNPALVVNINADLLESEVGGVGAATDAHQHDISLDFLLLAPLGSLNSHKVLAVLLVETGDLGAKLEFEALLLKRALESFPVDK